MKRTELVGINSSMDFVPLDPSLPSNLCDNPFFANNDSSPLRIVESVTDKDGLERSSFGNHAVCALLLNNSSYTSYSNKNDYKKDVLIYDACAGPALGIDFNSYENSAVDSTLTVVANANIADATNVQGVVWDDIN